MTVRRLMRTLILHSTLLLALASGARGQGLLVDQHNDPSLGMMLWTSSPIPIGQTFVPTTNTLNFVDIIARREATNFVTLVVDIRRDGIQGDLLGTSRPVGIPEGPVAEASPAGMLETPSYSIKVESQCPEGEVTCERVMYVGTSKKSGKSISLTGRTVHAVGEDGVTPSRFLGYIFKSGITNYFVSEEGELRVTRGSNVLIQERGEWRW